MKKLITILLAFVLLLLSSHIVSAASFTDVKSTHTFYQNIENLSNENIIKGYDDKTFRPDDPSNRGQMSKFIVKGLNIEFNSNCEPFRDLDKGNTFYYYIITLKCHGIISGYTDNTFRSDNYLTREAATKFVISAARFTKKDSTYFNSIYENVFSDVTNTSSFKDYVNSAFSHNIIKGYPDNKFNPKNSITRGEISKIIDITRGRTTSTNLCLYNGKQYNEASSFKATDNCNECICSNSEVKCTFNVCAQTVDYTLIMNNYSYSPNVIQAKPGEKLNIKLINQYGYHNFVIEELGIKSESITTGGQTAIEILIPLDAKGKKYEFYCNIGDHKDKGMVGYINVN